jgi:hypothetical protein
LLIPLLPTGPVDEPVVVPGAVVPVDVVPVPVELAPPLVDCASANVLVSANAAASPNVAILMDYSLFQQVILNGRDRRPFPHGGYGSFTFC